MQISINIINCTITDATGGMGGDTIIFAKNFKKVNVCEINLDHVLAIYNNLNIFNLINKVNLYHRDYLNIMNNLKLNIIFIDPPWGGPNYKKESTISLYLNEIPLYDIVN